MAEVYCITRGRDSRVRRYRIDVYGKKQLITAFEYLSAIAGKSRKIALITEERVECTYVTIIDEEKIEG